MGLLARQSCAFPTGCSCAFLVQLNILGFALPICDIVMSSNPLSALCFCSGETTSILRAPAGGGDWGAKCGQVHVDQHARGAEGTEALYFSMLSVKICIEGWACAAMALHPVLS